MPGVGVAPVALPAIKRGERNVPCFKVYGRVLETHSAGHGIWYE